MNEITFKGKPLSLDGTPLEPGDTAPDFSLIRSDLGECHLSDLKEDYIVLNIVPSLDTPVCAASAREFNRQAHDLDLNCRFLTISRDLPFAQSRFIQREDVHDMELLSDMRFSDFGREYGVLISSGPLKGLLARAVFLLGPESDTSGHDSNADSDSAGRNVLYREMIPEIAWEPDYRRILEVLYRENGDS
ncbi:thiol peroxidase [Salinispira pacifica]|uniref:Thiol peroxidase, Tpx-type n=1 Tax=Salinispira pacifica TaxID=1307761 RepID=V5WJ58_9SPIO|nr:thiol peroxidase [Salinispira pacifica]AHC15574.1 Thiol peroxidase, Tpx-type [Salinispira pacifica]